MRARARHFQITSEEIHGNALAMRFFAACSPHLAVAEPSKNLVQHAANVTCGACRSLIAKALADRHGERAPWRA